MKGDLYAWYTEDGKQHITDLKHCPKNPNYSLYGYEPTIELRVSDKTLSVNGNYRKGLIKEFVKANKA